MACRGPRVYRLLCPTPGCSGVFYRRVGCGNYDCAPCRAANSRRRGDRALQGLETLGTGALGRLVVTVPAELRQELADPRVLGRWRARTVAVVQDWLFETFGLRGDEEFGLVAFVHPTGEDGVTWKPHLELLFPLVSGDLRTVRVECDPARFVEVPAKAGLVALRVHRDALVPVAALDDLRRRYAESLGWPGPVDIYYEFSRGAARRAHRARYAARTFPGWGEAVGWVRYYGLLASRKRGLLKIVVKYNRLARPREPQRCPLCGAVLPSFGIAWALVDARREVAPAQAAAG